MVRRREAFRSAHSFWPHSPVPVLHIESAFPVRNHSQPTGATDGSHGVGLPPDRPVKGPAPVPRSQ